MAIQSTTRSDHLIRSLIGKNNMVRYFRKDAEFEAANAKVSWLGEQIPSWWTTCFFVLVTSSYLEVVKLVKICKNQFKIFLVVNTVFVSALSLLSLIFLKKEKNAMNFCGDAVTGLLKVFSRTATMANILRKLRICFYIYNHCTLSFGCVWNLGTILISWYRPCLDNPSPLIVGKYWKNPMNRGYTYYIFKLFCGTKFWN